MIRIFSNKILVVLGFVVVLLQTFILVYIYKKNGGTTGGDPVTPVFPFAVSLIVSLFIFIRECKIFSRSLNLAVITVSMFGCLLPYWLERTGILVQYERWLQNESIINTENLGSRLLSFAGVEFFVVVLVLIINRKWLSEKSNFQ